MSELIDYNEPLYRYRSLNVFSIKELVNGEFFFPTPNMLNDPFEATYEVKYIKSTKEELDNFVSNYKGMIGQKLSIKRKLEMNTFEHIRKDEFKNDIVNQMHGVLCFSKHNNEVLMWSHYSESHKGFCFEFDNKLIDLYSTDIMSFFKIKYNNHPVIINWSAGKILNKHELIKMITTKTLSWGYEGEFRALLNIERNKSSLFKFPKKLMKSIIFGCNMSDSDKTLLKNLIGKDKEYSHVTFKKAIKSSNSKGLEIVDDEEE